MKNPLADSRRRLTRVDLPFFVGVLLLLVIGLATLYSAGYAKALQKEGDSYFYIARQARYAALGLGGMIVVSWFPYSLYKRFAPLFYGLCVALLGTVLLVSHESERRWLYVGGIQFQPSEFAKVAVILLLAKYLAAQNAEMKNFWKGIVIPGLIFGLCAVLVGLEPHLSGAILICGIGVCMIIAAGASLLQMIPLGLVGAAGIVVLYLSREYMQKRVITWLHPEQDLSGDGYQALQSLYAIGSGGFAGLGYGNSRQKYLYLPEPQNDFIFSIFCEEMGWIAAVAVLVLFAFLVFRGFWIAMHCPDRFSSYVVVGISSRLAIQVMLNVAVVTGSIPVTGISLPFFSYGGTALLVLLGEMGIVLQISRHIVADRDGVPPGSPPEGSEPAGNGLSGKKRKTLALRNPFCKPKKKETGDDDE